MMISVMYTPNDEIISQPLKQPQTAGLGIIRCFNLHWTFFLGVPGSNDGSKKVIIK